MKTRHACALLLVLLIATSSLNSANLVGRSGDADFLGDKRVNEHHLSDSEGALWNVTFETDQALRPWRVFGAQSGGYFVLYSEYIAFSEQHENISIMKIDEYGNQLWNKTIYSFNPQLSIDSGRNMVATSDGGYTVLLNFRNNTLDDRFFRLFHLDAECNHLWNTTVPLGYQQWVGRMVECANGDYAFLGGGRFQNISHSFGVTLVVRTNSFGSLLWNYTYIHTLRNSGNDIVETSTGDVVVACDVGDFTYAWSDYFVMFLDEMGTHTRNATFSVGTDDFPVDLEVFGSDEFLLWGYSDSSKVLIHLNSSGYMTWTETYTSAYAFGAHDLQVLSDSSLALIGEMYTPEGHPAVWFQRMNSTGSVLWNATYGTDANYAGNSFVEVSPDVFVLVGDIREQVGETTYYDMWIAMISTPLLLNPAENQIHEISTHFSYQLSAESPVPVDTWVLNDSTYYSISGDGLVENASIVPVGTYGLAATVNDTYGRTKTTEFSVTVMDTSAPVWQPLPADAVFEYGTVLYYDLNAVDHSGISTYWVNDTLHFGTSPSGEITNATTLSLGDYPLLVSVNDTYDNILSHEITITVQDTTTPVPENVQDVMYEVDVDPGFWLNWSCSEYLPSSFELLLDDVHITGGPWTGSDVTYFVSGHDFGTYNYTIIFEDTSGNTGSDTVLVYADDTIAPTVTSPLNIYYVEGTTGSLIVWNATDLHPYSYSIYRDDVLIRSGGWAEDNIITISVDGLAPGDYSYSVQVFDVSGNSVSDSVIVSVGASGTTSTTTTTTTTFNETEWQSRVSVLIGQIGLLTIGLGIVGSISAASIVLVIFTVKRMSK